MIVFESEFILRFAGIVIHQFRLAFVVVGVFLDLVLQGTATEYEKVVPTVPVMFVGNSDCVAPLYALRQVVEHISLVIIGIFHPFIEMINIVSPDAQYG